MGIQIGLNIINLIVSIGVFAIIVLFAMVLFKLNKALTIWLDQNKKE